MFHNQAVPRASLTMLGVMLLALVAWPSPGTSAESAKRPNVVLIMADDLGYECIGANGGTSYKTPVLDQLAKGGVRFDHCFSQPLCTPTRMQLMTGLYNVRNYTEFGYMNPASVTFAHHFKAAGYATCIAGKWQLGRDVDLPQKFGFDESCLWQHTRRPSRYKNPGLEINGKEVDFTAGEYGPDKVNEYILDFIERKKAEAFFVYYPMILTHSPYDATPDSTDYDDKPRGEKDGKASTGSNRHFGDMVEYMDKLIGRLTARLDKLGLRENTLILFLGDNGTGAGTRSMMGDRLVVGGKGQTTAAGIHVPLIASWPGKIAAGKVCSDLVDSTDFLPTICQAAAIPISTETKPDGRSFLPQLRGEKGNPRDWIYCWYAPRGQMVGEFAASTRYKLYRTGQFYDLTEDVAEQRPLLESALNGEAAAAAKVLQAALDQFQNARPAALGKPAQAAKKAKATGNGKKKAKRAADE